MAQFDTALVLQAIVHEVLADHETNRQLIELIEDTRHSERSDEGDRTQLVWGVLELSLRQMAQSQHGRDLVVGLIDRFKEEALARSLSEIELMAAGLDPEEIEYTLRNYPEDFTPEGIAARRPTRRELDEAGAI